MQKKMAILYLLVVSSILTLIGSTAPWRPLIPMMKHNSLEENCVEHLLKTKLESRTVGEPTMWYYRGWVRDPSNGQRIVGIEGVERVVSIRDFNVSASNITAEVLSTETRQSPGSSLLTNSRSSSTYLTHKLFVYVNINNRSEAITKFRKASLAPLRCVNPVSELRELVSLKSQSALSDRFPKNRMPGAESHIFWPSGRRIYGQLTFASDFNTMADSEGSNPIAVGKSLAFAHSVRGNKKRPVRRWVSFHGSDDSNVGRSSEVYHFFRSEQPLQQLIRKIRMSFVGKSGLPLKHSLAFKYRRFGAAPAWLSPRKPCEIEIQGYRLESTEDLPDYALELLESCVPGFFQDQLTAQKFFAIGRDPYSSYQPWYQRFLTFLT